MKSMKNRYLNTFFHLKKSIKNRYLFGYLKINIDTRQNSIKKSESIKNPTYFEEYQKSILIIKYHIPMKSMKNRYPFLIVPQKSIPCVKILDPHQNSKNPTYFEVNTF